MVLNISVSPVRSISTFYNWLNFQKNCIKPCLRLPSYWTYTDAAFIKLSVAIHNGVLQSTVKEKRAVVDPWTKTTENLPCCLDEPPVIQIYISLNPRLDQTKRRLPKIRGALSEPAHLFRNLIEWLSEAERGSGTKRSKECSFHRLFNQTWPWAIQRDICTSPGILLHPSQQRDQLSKSYKLRLFKTLVRP